MPRKSKSTPPIVDQSDTGAFVEATESMNQLAILQQGYGQGRDLVNQMLGQIQMSRSISKFTDVVSLSKLKQIKENKMYRAVAGQKGVSPTGEEIPDVGTFEGFCKALGLSVSKVDEDIANLNTFGEDALNQLNSVGLGYRDLRQFRKLPADQKTALIEAAKEGDKDTLLELAEDLIAKHVKEKEALTTERDMTKHQLDETKADLESSRQRSAALTTKLQGKKLEAPTPDSIAADLVATAHEAEATACAWIEGHLQKSIATILEHDEQNDSNHRSVLSGFIARIEDATDALRVKFALPRIKTDDPFEKLPDDFLEQQGLAMPKPVNGA